MEGEFMNTTIRNFLVVLLVTGMVTACGGSDQQQTEQRQAQMQKKQARQDSIAKAKADSIARAKADSLAKAKKKQEQQKQKEKKEKDKLTLEDITFSSTGAFAVQVEAWRSREKAEEQVSKWKKRGFSNAYVVKHGNEDTGNIWFRVRLGKVTDESTAQQLSQLIQKKYSEKTWITESKSET